MFPRMKNPPGGAGGAGGATINVTLMFAGELWAPDAVTVTLPAYVPAVRLPTMAEICRVCGAVPEVGLTVSQAESLPAEKLSVPEPVLVTFTFAGGGFELLP